MTAGPRFTAKLWRYDGDAAWHFVTLPEELSDELRARTAHAPKAFGSAPVRVTIGQTSWETSVFWDTKRGSYLLPVKAPVRRKEGLEDGDDVAVELEPLAVDPDL